MHTDSGELDKLPPTSAPLDELHALKAKLAQSLEDIRNKHSGLTVQNLKRLLFRAAATLLAMPQVILMQISLSPY